MLQGPPYVRLPRATACPDAVYCQRLTSALRANSNFLLPSTFLRSLLRFLRLVIPTCRARITLPTSGRSCEHTTRLIQKPGAGTSFIRPAVQCGRHGLAELARLAPPAWHFSALPLRSCRFGPAASVLPLRSGPLSAGPRRHAGASRGPSAHAVLAAVELACAARRAPSPRGLEPIPAIQAPSHRPDPATAQAARILPGSCDQGESSAVQFGIKCIDCGGNPRFYRILSSPTRFEAIKRLESS